MAGSLMRPARLSIFFIARDNIPNALVINRSVYYPERMVNGLLSLDSPAPWQNPDS